MAKPSKRVIEYWYQCAAQQRKFAALAKIAAAHDDHMKQAHHFEMLIAQATGQAWEAVSDITSKE